jgi:futalosine hydrolase
LLKRNSEDGKTKDIKMVVGLISSVPQEGKIIAGQLGEQRQMSGMPLREGKTHGNDVIYIVSGMGKTNAAHAATVLNERFSPGIVILFGVGGAYPSAGLEVGDLAVAKKEIYGDEGVLRGDRFHGTEFIGIPLLKRDGKRYFNEFPLDRRLIRMALGSSLLVTRTVSGTFVTVSTCTGTKKRAFEFEKRFGAICENMEGAAVAHICAIYGIPVIEIRGISNIVDNRDKDKWNIGLAAEHCQKAVLNLLKLPIT